MLRCSALARAALRASKYDVPQTTRALNQLSILPHSASVSSSTVSNGSTLSFIRHLATKVVKKPARKTATGTKRKVTAKKRIPTKKKAAPKKKPTTRRKVAKKTVKKKAAPKRKVLTERQKLLAEKKKARDVLLTLKATALEEPKKKPETAWVVYVSENMKGKTGPASENIKAVSTSFKELSAGELEHYNHIANQNKAANAAEYAAWVSAFTPEQVRLANNARRLLKRKLPVTKSGAKPYGKGLSPIKDTRQIKRPDTAYLKFATERRTSGDFKNIKLGDAAKLITEEWNGLSAGEKKKYTDLQVADKERYIREYSRVYGHPPAMATAKPAAAAA